MKTLNEEFNFTYEIPEGYEEVKHEDYAKYGIDPSTVFTLFDKKAVSTISLNKDSIVSGQKEFEEVIELNATNMKGIGMDVESINMVNLKSPSEYKAYILKSVFKSLSFVIYFLVIRNMAFALTIQTDSKDDIKTVETLIESIEVLDE